MTGTTVHIDDVAPGLPINPDMWGVFFEDINGSADGGLYAELVRNRDFSFGPADDPAWHPLTGWTTDGTVEVGAARASGGHRVRLTAPATLENAGFVALPLTAGATYALAVRATPSPGADVRVALLDDAGEVVAETPVTGDTDAVLVPRRDAAHGRVRLHVASGSCEVWWVSLMPTATFRGEANGLRDDLARTIADLRPRFVRFPGGCVAHGFGLDNLYRWKHTVGPVEDRVGDRNIWGYHQSMGLGFFEYFRFCEQLGAEPLPVVAAGVCCQNSPGGQAGFTDSEMDDYVRDVLDLIEYANGPVDSPWGARRAAAGHPEPFGLRYLGVGNEDEITDAFAARFGRLLEAVRAAAPDIVVIGTAGPFPAGSDYDRGWELARELAVDIVDEHSYKAPKWYFEHLDRFDAYDRSGPRVYVGEYGSRGNTMLCALAEAAYMMGMERNGDVVRLASYAPLLARIDHTQWTPDLVYFDDTEVVLTLNYHVQSLHAHAAGTRALPVRVENAPTWERPRTGRIGIRVRAESGTLTVEHASLDAGGHRQQTGFHRGERDVRLPLAARGTDCTVRARVRLEEDGRDGFLVAFGDVDGPDHFEWRFGTWENRFLVLCEVSDGLSDEWTEPLPYRFDAGRTYDVEIRVEGGGRHVVCLLDGDVVHDIAHDGTPEQRFSASAVVDDRDGTTWLKVVNATDAAVPLAATLASGHAVSALEITSLTADPAEGRPFAPAPAAPRVSRVDGARWTVPPFTFAVARVVR
ncbi:alpha-L-arabinofuranosidase C-terminal domain-containing protein [Microbacterium sp. B19]|uniref:alpha-L-arabinofuranosidase C-terminal domain-containing protein n=1 Tax=Microbacterium sp. B19 TaxID=96765 RepID=UPI00034C696C|nr:alpha-L-arabinofuranosidase C-terminal domain-containing protein [Microbacterium sp. B19]